MEVEEQRRREMVERRKEDVIRATATKTGQSAQLLRAINRRTFNAPTDSLTDNRRDDIDILAPYVVYDMAAERDTDYTVL